MRADAESKASNLQLLAALEELGLHVYVVDIKRFPAYFVANDANNKVVGSMSNTTGHFFVGLAYRNAAKAAPKTPDDASSTL